MLMEKPAPASAGRAQVPDQKFIEEQFPEPVMPACPINKVLKGQKAIVTGGSSGIGKGIATALGHAGADVLVNYRSHAREAEEVAAEIRRCGTRALTFPADVSREEQVQAMFRRAIEEFGTVDILINNAGLQKDAPFDQMTLAQWQLVLNVNLTGQFLCAREAVREFKRRGVRKEVSCAAGKIICISSVHEVIPWAGHVNYAASKGGVMLMMKSIAQEVAPIGLRYAVVRLARNPWSVYPVPGWHCSNDRHPAGLQHSKHADGARNAIHDAGRRWILPLGKTGIRSIHRIHVRMDELGGFLGGCIHLPGLDSLVSKLFHP